MSEKYLQFVTKYALLQPQQWKVLKIAEYTGFEGDKEFSLLQKIQMQESQLWNTMFNLATTYLEIITSFKKKGLDLTHIKKWINDNTKIINEKILNTIKNIQIPNENNNNNQIPNDDDIQISNENNNNNNNNNNQIPNDDDDDDIKISNQIPNDDDDDDSVILVDIKTNNNNYLQSQILHNQFPTYHNNNYSQTQMLHNNNYLQSQMLHGQKRKNPFQTNSQPKKKTL